MGKFNQKEHMRRYKLHFALALLFSFVGAFMLVCIVFLNRSSSFYQIISYGIGGAFWLSVIAEQIWFWKANAERKTVETKLKQDFVSKKMPIGIVSFLKTTESRIADVALFLSAAVLAILIWKRVANNWLVIMTLSVLYLSFHMHCFLNGRNFRFIKAYQKMEEKKDA